MQNSSFMKRRFCKTEIESPMEGTEIQADIQALFNPEFDRNEQLALVASSLEHLRYTFATKWRSLGEGNRVPEFKAVVRSLVRAADESVDAHTTVAYVTKAALDELNAMADSRSPRQAFKKDLTDASRFRHEHATPVEVLVRTITLSQNQQVPIVEILEAMCCRVLVTSAERKKIDGEHAWTVPSSLEWADGIAFGLRTLEPSLIPLIRYHEVDPELARSLIPLGSVHADLIARFKTLIDAETPEELTRGFRLCSRKFGTSFVLSDEIYQGTSRRKVRQR